MRITKLPHWVMTDKFPAFYDSESATAIEQTAKVYGAMQELIKDYNNFIDELNVIIEDFTTSTNSNIEVFTTQMEQKFNDFVKIVELKITEQDQSITDTFNQMVDSIENEIKESVKNGELSEEIGKVVEDAITKIDLSDYVTKEYVDTAIENIEIPNPDLTGYATTDYVDTSIENIEIPNPDLTGYATTDYVDTSIENIEIPDLTGYATETYVNDAIANIDIPEGGGGDEIPKLETSAYSYLFNDGTVWINSDSELMTKFRTMMTAYKDKKLYEFWLTPGSISNAAIAAPWVVKFQLCTKTNFATMKDYSGDVTYKAVYPDTSDNSVMRSTILTFSSFGYDNTGSYSGGVPGSATITKYRCLTSQGTTAYTPTGDYHPANKKYVDDKVTIIDSELDRIDNGIKAKDMKISIWEDIDFTGVGTVDLSQYIDRFSVFAEHMTNGWSSTVITLSTNITSLGFHLRTYSTGNGTFKHEYQAIYDSKIKLIIEGTEGDLVTITSVKLEYGDKLITSYTGYDATKTQVLKNVNGTLTWVDE